MDSREEYTMSTLTTEGVFDGIPSRKDLKKHEKLRERVVDCKNDMFKDVDEMKKELGDDFDFLMKHIKETYFIQTFKKMFADQKLVGGGNPRYRYHPPEAFGSTYKRGQAGSHHSDLIFYLSNINLTIRSLCLLLRLAMDKRRALINQTELNDIFNKSERSYLRGENDRLKAKNAELEKQLKKALNSKTTGEESDWDILGLVEDSPIEDVKKQAKLMLLINHPDKSGQLKLLANREKAEARYKRINQAYERLKAILKKRAIAAKPKITEEELSKYSARFEPSNPYII